MEDPDTTPAEPEPESVVREATVCAKCGRAVWISDVDASGKCILCINE